MNSEEKEGIINNTERLLRLSEISLWLDSYNDIFSSFDPRPYSERALSEDFLNEAKRASIDKNEATIELKLLIPHAKRNLREENLIRKRLREHFRKHFAITKQGKKSIVKKGLLMALVGVIMMVGVTFILSKDYKTFLSSLAIVLLEPGGWFMFWEGLDLVFFKAKEENSTLEFYEKMSNCQITFFSY
jgi:hypothetical protein